MMMGVYYFGQYYAHFAVSLFLQSLLGQVAGGGAIVVEKINGWYIQGTMQFNAFEVNPWIARFL